MDQSLARKHLNWFMDFCRYEKLTGGPDPHLTMTGEVSGGLPLSERAWRGGCYIGVYNVPAAEVIWRDWPLERALKDSDGILLWLRRNWSSIPTRVERRCVRKPELLWRFLSEYAGWVASLPMQSWTDPFWSDPCTRYEAAWLSCQSVFALGRYVAHKLLEYGARYCSWPTQMPDIRPVDGWSPRGTLALLFPERASLHSGGTNSRMAIAAALKDSTSLKARAEARGVPLTWFELQVLLCEYRECYEGLRQYPGRSLDSELGYYHKIMSRRKGHQSALPEVREHLFPRECLGERNTWKGPRRELGRVLRQHSYVWSDLLFDYGRTVDISTPVRRRVINAKA